MDADGSELRTVAAALDGWVALVRAHAARVAASAGAACWSSPAARAYAGHAVELAGRLHADADRAEAVAAQFRRAAVEVAR